MGGNLVLTGIHTELDGDLSANIWRMSWLQFVASLVDALVWPALIAFVIFGFRRPFSALLRNGLKRLKAGPIEMEWEAAALETRAELEASKVIESVDEPDVLQALLGVVRSTKQDEAHLQPVIAILVAYRAVELALTNALGVQAPDESDAVELAAAGSVFGHVAPTTRRVVLRLRDLRNLARYGQTATGEQAEEFCDLAIGVIEQIQAVRDAKGS